MASMAISAANSSNSTQSLATPKAAPAPAETTAQAPASLKPDTVKLSPAAQARMMHRAGESPALIASSLGTSLGTIDGYLSIKAAVPVSPAPTVEPVKPDAVEPQSVIHRNLPAEPAPAAANPAAFESGVEGKPGALKG